MLLDEKSRPIYPCFSQLLQQDYENLLGRVFHSYTMVLIRFHKMKSGGVRSGDRGGYGIGHLDQSINTLFKCWRTKRLKFLQKPHLLRIQRNFFSVLSNDVAKKANHFQSIYLGAQGGQACKWKGYNWRSHSFHQNPIRDTYLARYFSGTNGIFSAAAEFWCIHY